MVDVFAGAGGLSLGFKWQGWQSLTAVDLDPHSIRTFNRNVADVGFVGDLRDPSAVEQVLRAAASSRDETPLALIGGPPCQGFSTGGHRRSEHDERNTLYLAYAELLRRLKPDVFLFENVTGLLSMSKGGFLPLVRKTLEASGYDTLVWKVNAAEFGIPQRRQRVIIVGVPTGRPLPPEPCPWTSAIEGDGGKPTITTKESIGDLPVISAGENGSGLTYRCSALSEYQAMMRGELEPHAYLASQRISALRVRAA
jgi:DNA (cytosine-5)-methyltransferase 1